MAGQAGPYHPVEQKQPRTLLVNPALALRTPASEPLPKRTLYLRCPSSPSQRSPPPGRLVSLHPKGFHHPRAPSALHQNFPVITYFLYRRRQQTLKTTNWFHLRWFQLTGGGFPCDKECEAAQKSAKETVLISQRWSLPAPEGQSPLWASCLACSAVGWALGNGVNRPREL